MRISYWSSNVCSSDLLLQLAGFVPGFHDRPHHDAARPDLSLHVYSQTAGRAGGIGSGAKRSIYSLAAKAVFRNYRFLSAAGRLQLPDGGGADEKIVQIGTAWWRKRLCKYV